MKYWIVFALLCVGFWATNTASAYVIVEREPEEIFREATAVVEGRIVKVEPVFEKGGLVFSYVTLSVVEIIKGDNVAEEITIRSLGGDTGTHRQIYEFTPIFHEGDRAIVCLGAKRNGYYDTFGLLRCQYVIENNMLKNHSVSVDAFKAQIDEVIQGSRSKITLDIPRPRVSDFQERRTHHHKVRSSASKLAFLPGQEDHVWGNEEGSHFDPQNESFPISTTTVDIYYNPANAHGSASNMAALIDSATARWNGIPNLKIDLNYAGTTSDTVGSSTNVIGWNDLGDGGLLAREVSLPDSGVGIGNKTGTGIFLNNNSAITKWYFDPDTPPENRNEDYDMFEILMHEFGHTLCLDHAWVYELMVEGYLSSELPFRSMGAADTAGAIHQHPATSGTISHPNVYWGLTDITLTGNITIANGGLLYVEYQNTVYLDGYTIETESGGELDDGSPPYEATWVPDIRISSKPHNRYPTIQSAINDASSGDSVLVNSSGVFNEYLLMQNGVSLINDSGDSVAVTNTGLVMVLESGDNNITVDGITFTSTSVSAVHIEDATGVVLKSCKINASGFYALTIHDTDVDITGGRASNSLDTGIYLSGSDTDITSFNITNNGNASDEYGLYCQDGSEPTIGGFSYFSNNEGYDIYATANCGDIDAEGNLWEHDPPDVYHESGTIDVNPYYNKPALFANTRLAEAEALERAGRALVREGNNDQAFWNFKQVVDDYPETGTALYALDHASAALWRQKDFAGAVNYLDAIAQKHAGSELGRKAEYLSLRHLVKLGHYEDVIARADVYLNLYPQASQASQVMLRKGRVLMWQLEKYDEAEDVFQQVIETYGDQRHPRQMAQVYLNSLEQLGHTVQFARNQAEQEKPKTQVLGNHPNPFNPATTIAFTLADAGSVNLVIYNALGQKVRTLIADSPMKAGGHRVMWDGKDEAGLFVSSGVYLYEIQAGDFVGTRKMVMLK